MMVAGDMSLGVEDEPDQGPQRTATTPKPVHNNAKPNDGRDVGAALRSVYQKTVEEQVPDEFLDLLGKLG